jgi:hypothetical protein
VPSSGNSSYEDITVSFVIDLEKERTGYYFSNAPKDAPQRSMQKIATVRVKSYKQTEKEPGLFKCTCEVDVESLFNVIVSSQVKPRVFEQLFLDYGAFFLPTFEKWETINKK